MEGGDCRVEKYVFINDDNSHYLNKTTTQYKRNPHTIQTGAGENPQHIREYTKYYGEDKMFYLEWDMTSLDNCVLNTKYLKSTSSSYISVCNRCIIYIYIYIGIRYRWRAILS